MRLFFVAQLLAWTVGVALGVLGVAYFWLLLVAALLTTIGRLWRLTPPYLVACLGLFFLGSLWGSLPAGRVATCNFGDSLTGQVQSVFRREATRAQYLLKESSGCTVLVITNRWPAYDPGNVLAVSGTIQPVQEIPPEFAGYAEYLERQGIAATIRYPKITVQTSRVNILAAWNNYTLQKINQVFVEPEASIIAAMLLADSGSIPDDITENFRRTGISHILAISGQNLSLLAALLLIILLLLPLSPLTRTGILTSLLWLYVAFLAFPISATRAVVFWTVAMLAWHINGLVSLPTVIILALTAMISASPAIIMDVGWQLSFAAVVGIGLALFLQRKQILISWQTLLLSTIGATLATYPIVSYHFGSLALSGLPVNLLVLPVTSAFMILALAALLTSFIVPTLSLMISYLVHILWVWIEQVTIFFSSIPGLYWEGFTMSWWTTIIYYVTAATIAQGILRRQNRRWREIWQ